MHLPGLVISFCGWRLVNACGIRKFAIKDMVVEESQRLVSIGEGGRLGVAGVVVF
jgi:hypothetical protein